MSKGYFISLEGIDGTGKTTQMRLLAEHFTRTGRQVLCTKQPGDIVDGKPMGSNIGSQIREMLFFKPSTNNLAPGVSDMLFLADAIQVVEQDIKPALTRGDVVICDRYVDSQFAYSVHKHTPDWCNPTWLEAIDTWPDSTVLLTGDPETLMHRTKARLGTEAGKQDGKIWAGVMQQLDIQNSYLKQLGPKERTIIIDVGAKSKMEVFVHILAALKARMPETEQEYAAG